MRPKRAVLGWIIWACSLAGSGFCAISYARTPPAVNGPDRSLELVLFSLVTSVLSSSVAFFSHRALYYRVALGGRILSLFLLMIWVSGCPQIEFVLLGFVVVEISLYESYPRNLYMGAAVAVMACGIKFSVSLLGLRLSPFEALLGQFPLYCVVVLILLPAGLLTKYREDVIAVMKDRNRLDETVLELAKTNLQYQEFATGAVETGMREERLRITRDIHDVVGYTLTNNIAMMEAATDMMRRNPLGVPALIRSARDNAKEGLQQIRVALYKLRAQSTEGPRGLRALTRLCRLFERATRIEVRLAYGNVQWEYGDAIDSVIYHLVQEALLNAFRHGKAMHSTVALWENDRVLTVSISDDGIGATSVQEGIGLRGMRERITAIGGHLDVGSMPRGFTVRAELPLPEVR